MERVEEVLSFWFGSLEGPDDMAEGKMKMWFGGGPELDAEIKERFEQDVIAAGEGRWDNSPPRRALAKIILLDQFTRNIWRNTARAFAYDAEALSASRELVERGADQELYPIERVFVYMPFEHAENEAMQAQSVALFTRLRDQMADSPHVSLFDNFLDYAQKHKAIIDRFGRYPHRNEVLGRASTPEEQAYMRDGGESFGQGGGGEEA